MPNLRVLRSVPDQGRKRSRLRSRQLVVFIALPGATCLYSRSAPVQGSRGFSGPPGNVLPAYSLHLPSSPLTFASFHQPVEYVAEEVGFCESGEVFRHLHYPAAIRHALFCVLPSFPPSLVLSSACIQPSFPPPLYLLPLCSLLYLAFPVAAQLKQKFPARQHSTASSPSTPTHLDAPAVACGYLLSQYLLR